MLLKSQPLSSRGYWLFLLFRFADFLFRTFVLKLLRTAVGFSELPTYQSLALGRLVMARNYLTDICSGSKEGSYLRPIDICITQL